MEYSREEDSSTPKKRTVKVHLQSGDIWFTQVDEEPSQDELAAWVEEYAEEASKRLRGDPLIVNVVTEGLRPE
jgi:hypothetical protein